MHLDMLIFSTKQIEQVTSQMMAEFSDGETRHLVKEFQRNDYSKLVAVAI